MLTLCRNVLKYYQIYDIKKTTQVGCFEEQNNIGKAAQRFTLKGSFTQGGYSPCYFVFAICPVGALPLRLKRENHKQHKQGGASNA